MRTLWRVIVRTLCWSYERGSWPYDVLVLLIVVFVLFSPRGWFRDQPRVGSASSIPGVELVSEGEGGRTRVFRVQPGLLDLRQQRSELERQTHELLRDSVEDLRDRSFRIEGIHPIQDPSGTILYYKVSIRL